MTRTTALLAAALLVPAAAAPGAAPQDAPQTEPFAAAGIPPVALPDEPIVYDTAAGQRIRVVVAARGLTYPWGLAFLPDGSALVTERLGALRRIRAGAAMGLDPQPLGGVPDVYTEVPLAGLMDVAVHPQFGENRFVYLTYSKPAEGGSRVALARGRLEEAGLSEVRDLLVTDGTNVGGAARLAFAPDGMLYMTVGGAFGGVRGHAQDPATHAGKVLRLRDDGSAPDDNPFAGREGHAPEVYSMGHRNPMGLAIHPETGEPWASEHGVMGGDEVNVIRPGANYGWPDVSYSREYFGLRVAEQPWQAQFEQPEIVWVPSIAPSGLVFYTGDRFPAWRGDLFVGSLMIGRVARTGHVERIEFNRQGLESRREWLLADLRQRIRDVEQGPDGLLYVLTGGAFLANDPDAGEAALLRIEPVE